MNFAVRIKSIGGMQVKSHNSVKQGLSDYFSTLSVAASSALNRLNFPSDQEALHDFRIHLRSQRVLLNLFPHSRFLRKQREQLHAAAALTNSQRDLEVAVGLAKSLMDETQVGQKQLLFLGEELEATRTKIAVDLQTMQLPHVFMSASLYWGKKISKQRKHVLQGRARRCSRRLEKCVFKAAKDLQQTSPVYEWHYLRICVKHLRYWNEGFSAFLTVRQYQQLPFLIQLQRCLGAVHDYDIFKQIICSDMPMPDQWLVILDRWQQHALTDASDLLMHFKKNDRT